MPFRVSRAHENETDGNGNLTSITDRRLQQTGIAYDAANRPLRITYHDGTVQERTYDAVGRLTEIREPDNAQRMDYDALDRVVRVVSESLAGFTTVAYEYDALDRRTKRTVSYPGGVLEETVYAYDKASRLTSITQTGVNGTQVTTYTWDAASRLTQKVLPNGIRQELAYDDANRLLSITYLRTDDTILETVAYAYDANGQRVVKSVGMPSPKDTSFTAAFDAANRMTAITLNPGTGLEKTYNLSYDDHGNLVGKQNAADGSEATLYTWDARNRLSFISMTEGGQTSTAAFKYDALGRRVERIVTQGATTQRTQYVYDGIQAIGELADGQLAATILTGLNIDEVIARTVNVSGGANPTATKSYLTDALGSVLAMTNEGQNPEVFYGYSAYGETQVIGVDGYVPSNSNQYTARENDGLMGGTNGSALYYYRARYYDPALKRFVSEDPIGLLGGIGPYSYVNGAPTNLTDPKGLYVGSDLARLLGLVLERTPDEIAYIGRILDVAAGAGTGLFEDSGTHPICLGNVNVSDLLLAVKGIGGAQSISLSTATTFGLYGAGATVGSATATAALPLGLAAYGGYEVGTTISRVWERVRGNSIGGDIYDFIHSGRLYSFNTGQSCGCPR